MTPFQSIITRTGHVIDYLSDLDFYKITMLQFLLHRFPGITGRYKFKNRSGVKLGEYAAEINQELDWLCTLRFQEFELISLQSCPFLTSDFINFLRLFQLNRNHVKCWCNDEGRLEIEAEGSVLHIKFFEIYVLEIVEEIYVCNKIPNLDFTEGRERRTEKIRQILEYTKGGKPFSMADFGGRRRASGLWHEETIWDLSRNLPSNVFVGTSNVLLAIKYGIKWIGTMAHEIFQIAQALGVPPVDSQRLILDLWAKEYRGDLGIALTDTLGFDKFLFDFDKYFAKLYDGGRHDSGCPYKWGDKFINHYKSFGIDPMTKTGVFSDGLKFPLAFEINDYFLNKIKTSFGIGTFLTNDLGVIEALQIVMKIVMCNGKHVAKVSDSPGKTMCESERYSSELRRDVQEQLSDPNAALAYRFF